MIEYKGLKTSDFDIVVHNPQSLIVKAPKRYEEIVVDGRHGSSHHSLGYSAVDIALTMYLTNPDKLDEVFEWLSGTGELSYKGRTTQVTFLDGFYPERKIGMDIVDIPLRRQPFWYKKEDPYVAVTTNIVNEGTTEAQPLIKLTKGTTQVVEFKINDVHFKYDFKTESQVIIDCREMDASLNRMPRNKQLTIGYEFPVLRPGSNPVVKVSGDATMEVKRKDIWL